MADRQRVALIFGGRSGEHQVSVVSARSVARALGQQGFELIPMAIDRDGSWANAETAADVLESSGDRTDHVVEFRGDRRLDPRLLDGACDVVFPVLHGPFGEDGTIQGVCEILDLPYVGCGVAASALCMDKIACKSLLVHGGFATAPWVNFDRTGWLAEAEALAARCIDLGLPLFVKPACLGSSVGISRVAEPTALDAAVNEAFEHDHRVLVERGITGREIEVAVLGNEEPRAALPGEVVPGHEFYDYADKYLDDDCQLLAPAPLDKAQIHAIQELAVRVYRHLGCAGMARVDLFLDEARDRLWVNEVNTIPGFTSISMYPKLWGVSGLPYPELVAELVRLAIERHGSR